MWAMKQANSTHPSALQGTLSEMAVPNPHQRSVTRLAIHSGTVLPPKSSQFTIFIQRSGALCSLHVW